jgi:hypothetical protein
MDENVINMDVRFYVSHFLNSIKWSPKVTSLVVVIISQNLINFKRRSAATTFDFITPIGRRHYASLPIYN